MASSRSATFRKAALLILLLAAAIAVTFQYMPREEPADMASPTQKRSPAPQTPLPATQQENQRPAGEKPSPQPLKPGQSPGIAVPPLNYEKPPATVFVSSSPSDSIVPASIAPANSQAGSPRESVSDSAENPAPVARPMPSGPIPVKVSRYAKHLLAKHDADGDGSLSATEWKQMAGSPAKIDYDADGLITVDELAAYWADYGRDRRIRLTGSMVEAVAEAPLWIPTAEHEARAAADQAAQDASRQASESDSVLPVALPGDGEEAAPEDAADAEQVQEPAPAPAMAGKPNTRRFAAPKNRLAGLPAWFLSKDANGDGQLTMAEYAPNGSQQLLADFRRLDRNGDGVLTAEECPR